MEPALLDDLRFQQLLVPVVDYRPVSFGPSESFGDFTQIITRLDFVTSPACIQESANLGIYQSLARTVWDIAYKRFVFSGGKRIIRPQRPSLASCHSEKHGKRRELHLVVFVSDVSTGEVCYYN
jgi:hypothetical protein